MPKETRIPFSDAMIRATIAGRKTMTRRVKKGDKCPYGGPGDVLIFTEPYCIESCQEVGWYEPPFSDGRPLIVHEDDGNGRWWQQAHYRATDPKLDLCIEESDGPSCGWSPPRFMPKIFSRIRREIVAVRAERLQEITEENAAREGFARREHFIRCWDELNAGRGYGWDTNPDVWVIEWENPK